VRHMSRPGGPRPAPRPARSGAGASDPRDGDPLIRPAGGRATARALPTRWH
jgi:hypothetical protein